MLVATIIPTLFWICCSRYYSLFRKFRLSGSSQVLAKNERSVWDPFGRYPHTVRAVQAYYQIWQFFSRKSENKTPELHSKQSTVAEKFKNQSVTQLYFHSVYWRFREIQDKKRVQSMRPGCDFKYRGQNCSNVFICFQLRFLHHCATDLIKL